MKLKSIFYILKRLRSHKLFGAFKLEQYSNVLRLIFFRILPGIVYKLCLYSSNLLMNTCCMYIIRSYYKLGISSTYQMVEIET